MKLRPSTEIVNLETGRNYAIFYDDGETTFETKHQTEFYSSQGIPITIPADLSKYPKAAKRPNHTTYLDDSKEFQQAFLELVYPKMDHSKFKMKKLNNK